MRLIARAAVVLVSVFGLGLAFAWAWDSSDANAANAAGLSQPPIAAQAH